MRIVLEMVGRLQCQNNYHNIEIERKTIISRQSSIKTIMDSVSSNKCFQYIKVEVFLFHGKIYELL